MEKVLEQFSESVSVNTIIILGLNTTGCGFILKNDLNERKTEETFRSDS